MVIPILLAAVLQFAPSAEHEVKGGFGIVLGADLGDMRAKGWNHTLQTDLLWNRSGDGFFDQVTVTVLPEINMPLEIFATRFYRDDNRAAAMIGCRQGLASLSATLRGKYPNLREVSGTAFDKELEKILGEHVELGYVEPSGSGVGPAQGRTVRIACFGPPGGAITKPRSWTQLTISYKISPLEIQNYNTAIRAMEELRALDRGKAAGLKPDQL